MSKTIAKSTSYTGAAARAGKLALAALGGLALLAAVAAQPRAAAADPGGVLDGSWRGGGSVSYPSGAKERANCKATYKRISGATYTVNAVCASASGRVSQTATVQRQGGDVYTGSFFNKEYGVDGSIYIKVSGNSQNVTLNGGGGTANFRLSR